MLLLVTLVHIYRPKAETMRALTALFQHTRPLASTRVPRPGYDVAYENVKHMFKPKNFL